MFFQELFYFLLADLAGGSEVDFVAYQGQLDLLVGVDFEFVHPFLDVLETLEGGEVENQEDSY